MDRSMIRKRWQITIPRNVRRLMGLFIGQVLNWKVMTPGHEGELLILLGQWAEKNETEIWNRSRRRGPKGPWRGGPK